MEIPTIVVQEPEGTMEIVLPKNVFLEDGKYLLTVPQLKKQSKRKGHKSSKKTQKPLNGLNEDVKRDITRINEKIKNIQPNRNILKTLDMCFEKAKEHVKTENEYDMLVSELRKTQYTLVLQCIHNRRGLAVKYFNEKLTEKEMITIYDEMEMYREIIREFNNRETEL